jgi:two-component system, cell cycle response regulator
MSLPRILVVEDEAIVAKDIENALHILGYSVPAIAASGEAAIEKAEALHPDLVLMDIRLKGPIDGVRAASEISGRLGIPIVYVTAHADEPTLRRAKITQPFGYVVKPFDERDLHAAVELALHRHRTQATLRTLALVDELTGLYNRRGFLSLARQHQKFARRTKKGFWLICLDVDRLKQINDRFGHREGDAALVATAEVLRKTFRESDVMARLGGDEFVVLAIQAEDDAVGPMITRLQEKLDLHNRQESRGYEVALSVGVVRFDPAGGTSLAELLIKADEALYEQKRSKQKAS